MATIIISVLASAAASALVARSVVRRELERAAAGRVEATAPQPVSPASPAVAVVPAAPAAPAPAPAPIPAPAPVAAEVTPEILMVLSAAVAAFLGKRARIKSARLRPAGPDMSSAWAQQGRVFVQASHNLPHHTGGRF